MAGGNRKPKAKTSEEKTTPKSPVTLRLGDLEEEVQARARGAAPGSIVRRDLTRYYRLLRDYEIRFMSVDEADVVAHALRAFDDGAYQYVWAAVDDALSSRDVVLEKLGVRDRFWRVDRDHINVQLRSGLTDCGKRMAILDAVERYWARLDDLGIEPPYGGLGMPKSYDKEFPVTDLELDVMVEVGLVGPGTARHYRKERDDPARTAEATQPSPAEEYVSEAQASAAERLRKHQLRLRRQRPR